MLSVHSFLFIAIPVVIVLLPKSLLIVRSAVVSLLRSRHHFCNIYVATNITLALKVAANINGNPAINHDVNALLLFRAFAFDGMDDIFLSLKDVFGYWRNLHWRYIGEPIRITRDDGGGTYD